MPYDSNAIKALLRGGYNPKTMPRAYKEMIKHEIKAVEFEAYLFLMHIKQMPEVAESAFGRLPVVLAQEIIRYSNF